MSRVLLITGTSGIAAATARLATTRGDRVFVIGNSEEQGQALSSELNNSAYCHADVSDEDAIHHAIATCINKFGAIDAVFNVAGLSGRSLGDGPLHQCSTSAWQTLMDVHATGTFFVCREAIRHWLAADRPGIVLNTSSVLAHFPEREHFATVAYASSKGAIESMTLSVAAYYAYYKIRLNVLAPGLVKTPMSARAQSDPTILEFMKHKQPLKGNFVEADELARVAYFLLSEESYPMTGEIIRADAGWAVTG
ncbi:MAG: SDR family NAD(P)-dependent oxidoreductase [Acidobacteriaceae bacterium]